MKWDEFIIGFIFIIIGIIINLYFINFYVKVAMTGFMIGIGSALMAYSYYDIKEVKKK